MTIDKPVNLGTHPTRKRRHHNGDNKPTRRPTTTPPLLDIHSNSVITMPGPMTTLLIEGSFEELSDELAQYIDNLKKSHGDENSNIQTEVASLLQENKKDEVLKKLVMGSQALNQAPEKGKIHSKRHVGSEGLQ